MKCRSPLRYFHALGVYVACASLFVPPPPASARQTRLVTCSAVLTVTFTGLRNDKGVLRVTLFDDANGGKGFPGDAKSAKQCRVVVLAGTAREATVSFTDLRPGAYAVAAFHDENDNDKMDFYWYGKPKEGSATSNNPHPRMRAPRWGEARFNLPRGSKAIYLSLFY